MRVVDFLRGVRDGAEPTAHDLADFVRGVTAGDIPDYQASAFLMAVCLRGLSHRATCALTLAMSDSGDSLDMSGLGGPVVDKHSTGGVGDKVSLCVAPLAAACGLKVPMIAGRGLGHTGGTIDKLEAISGFDVRPSAALCRQRIAEVGVCMMGQTARIAPADRKLYALRDVTATVESIPLICASILAKKLCEGIDALVLDVKVGRGAFMRDLASATALAQALVAVGEHAGLAVRAVLTAMDQPLGRAVGNALEVVEAHDILRGCGPPDTTLLTVELVAHMLVAAGSAPTHEAAHKRARQQLDNGAALATWRRIVTAHGGDPEVIDRPDLLPQSPHRTDLICESDAVVQSIDSFAVGQLAVRLGAGRARAEDTIDPAVGMVFHAKVGDSVAHGAPLVTVHHASRDIAAVMADLRTAIHLGDTPTPPPPVMLGLSPTSVLAGAALAVAPEPAAVLPDGRAR